MTCAAAWMQRALRRRDGVKRLVVWDEAWEIMAHLGCARWMRRSLKYGRAYDVANLVIAHRATDLLGAGDAGTEQYRIAQGLLPDCETRIFYWQRREHLNAVQDLVQLTDVECDHISPPSPRPRALAGRPAVLRRPARDRAGRVAAGEDGRLRRRRRRWGRGRVRPGRLLTVVGTCLVAAFLSVPLLFGASQQPAAAAMAPAGAALGGTVTAPLLGVVGGTTTELLPGVPAGGYPDHFPYGECTYWAALNHRVTWSGNAAEWAVNAAAQARRSGGGGDRRVGGGKRL